MIVFRIIEGYLALLGLTVIATFITCVFAGIDAKRWVKIVSILVMPVWVPYLLITTHAKSDKLDNAEENAKTFFKSAMDEAGLN